MNTTRWRQVKGILKAGGRSGAILGMVLVIVLALSLLGLGLMQLGQVNAVEVVRSYNLNRAFWAAEAGIFHARTMLRGSSTFRNSPVPLSGMDPAYGVTATAEGDGVYTVRSTGTVGFTSRVIWQTLFAGEVPPAAFNYALFGGDGTMDLRRDPTIEGDVFQNGSINFMPPAVVTNGTVSATDPADISPSSLPIVPPPDPAPTFPMFDPGPAGAGYLQLISDASSSSFRIFTNDIRSWDLRVAGTNYIQSVNLTIANGVIQGPGALAVSGDVTILDNVTLTNGVQIIAGGTLKLNCNPCIAGTNCLIYAKTAIDTISSGSDSSIGTITLITSGDVGPGGGLAKSLTVVGVLYAAGEIKAKKDLFVTGSVLAGMGIDVAKDFSLTYSNLWPVPLLPGFTAEVAVTNIMWREVF